MPASTTTPEKWWKIYQGDKECRLFKALARGTDAWRSVKGLAKAAKLTSKEVEAILHKYMQVGVVQQSSKNPDLFRYWERATTTKKNASSISNDDKKRRIDDKLKTNSNP